MIQEVITLILLALAIAYSVFALLRFMYPGKNKKVHSCGLTNCKCGEMKQFTKTKNDAY